MSKTVLLSAPYMLPTVERFRPAFARYGIELIAPVVEERMEAEQILHYAGQFDGAICGDDRFTAEVLAACAPRLKVISKWGTGIDSIDQAAAAQLGIAVRNTPGAFTEPVADSVLSYILAFARQSPWMDRAMKAGQWEKLPGRSLSECTLGVIGVGRIGKAVLGRAQGFGMRLLGHDILEMPADFLQSVPVQMTSLDHLLAEADFISLNCDLNPSSQHIINAATLAQVKPGALLVNTARGPLVDEKALVAALQAGRLAGAGLDVFEHEPLPQDSPLLAMDNVLLAAHNSNASPRAWEHVHWNTIRNLLDGLGLAADSLRPEDYPPLA
ncbi:MAG: phosphoglycerate dehydrogenase [Anaerolineales bacterium]|nr:phosphoglycerate dehydrogenase [Anaerolineales bacterium]MCW5855359.1 phosphoglycerate dehydrogenase [Anaerolineales bacterium]